MDDTIRPLFEICQRWDVPVTIADPGKADCPLVFANAAFEALTGYSEAEVVGRNCRFLQGAATDRVEIEHLKSDIARRQSAIACVANYKKNGEIFNNLLFIERIRVAHDHEVLIGCQYDFGLRVSDESVLGMASSFDQYARRFREVQSETLRMRLMTFEDRSRATLQRVRAYLALAHIKSRQESPRA